MRRHPIADDQLEAWLAGDMTPVEAGLVKLPAEVFDRQVRCYRIEVDHWPEGKPWMRFYGPHFDSAPEHRWEYAIPEFVRRAVEGPRAARLTSVHFDQDDNITGVVMPPIGPHAQRRQVFLSASGVHGIVKEAELFGAVARVVRSKPVQW